jgi:pimeloyl-ACP methyl ester carboxylesterase
MTGCAHLQWRGAPLDLEYEWVGESRPAHPTVVFLHEGLGSVALWKDFPERFCRTGGFRGLVFSRYGYGRSTPRPIGERWPVDFMHQQAWDVLPVLFDRLGIERPWLFGHSDGGSIALLYAARFPDAVSGLVVVAPHIMVEEISVGAIAQARSAYLEDGLRERLARYHADADSAFWGWNDIWLDPAFRGWDIRDHLPAIRAPLLAVQGEDDEYGTLAQIDGIAGRAPQTRLLVLPACGHSPHRDQPGRLIDEATRFIIGADASKRPIDLQHQETTP